MYSLGKIVLEMIYGFGLKEEDVPRYVFELKKLYGQEMWEVVSAMLRDDYRNRVRLD